MDIKKTASRVNRRSFMQSSVALAGAPLLASEQEKPADQAAAPPDYSRKLKIGVVGCGGRGSWIAQLFKKHPGYEFVAVADYFQDNANRCGKSLGVEPARQFSGLSGYKKVIASGIEAVVLETPPCFFPEHAAAAADAGLHVYMAKPVASDVPGCLTIEKLATNASRKQRCFFVDYQMQTDPINIEIVKRIHEGAMGKLDYLVTLGFCTYFEDPPYTSNRRGALTCQVYGGKASAEINYWGNSFLRGGAKPYRGGEVVNLYQAGAERNIAEFYQNVTQGKFDNTTVRRAVDGALATILGREAGLRHTRLTMDQILKENKRLEVDLSGLKA